MICSLCGDEISPYNAELHHLIIDEKRSAEICSPCLDKLFKWQGRIYAKLFPTSAMKKRFGNARA